MTTRFAFLAALLVTTVSASAWAGGYYSGTKGAHAAGRGGAFTVAADDIMAAAFNPAGFARLEGTSVQLGNRFSHNSYSYDRQPTLDWGSGSIPSYIEFERVENEKPWQILDPLLGATTDFGLDDWGFALVVYAPPGISQQEYPVGGGQRYMMVSRKAEIINYSLNAAYNVTEDFGVGVSLQTMYLRTLDYQLVIDGTVFSAAANPVSSEYDILSTVSGSDFFTPNAVLGVWYRAAPFLEFGLAGQVIPTSFKTDSTLSTEPVVLQEEVALTREGLPADDVTVELPLPLLARFGVRYLHLEQARPVFDLELNVALETFSRVDKFTVDSNDLVATLAGDSIDVGVIEIDKQWRDTITVSLGSDFVAVPDLLTARAGVYYETAVAKPEYANVDFPSGEQLGAALGASVFVGPVEVALGYEFRHQPEVGVTEGDGHVYQEVPASQCVPPYTDPALCNERYLGQPAPTVNGGRFRASSHMASLDVMYRF